MLMIKEAEISSFTIRERKREGEEEREGETENDKQAHKDTDRQIQIKHKRRKGGRREREGMDSFLLLIYIDNFLSCICYMMKRGSKIKEVLLLESV